jgi:hypothetical protein
MACIIAPHVEEMRALGYSSAIDSPDIWKKRVEMHAIHLIKNRRRQRRANALNPLVILNQPHASKALLNDMPERAQDCMNLVKKEGRHYYVAKGMVEPSDEELLQPMVEFAAKQKLTIVKCIELHGTPEQKHCLKNMSMKNTEELAWLTKRSRNVPLLYRVDDTHGRSIVHQDLLPNGALQGMKMRCVVLGTGQEQSMYDEETTVHIQYYRFPVK